MDKRLLFRIGRNLLPVVGLALFITGCAPRITAPPKVKTKPPELLLHRSGYTIQVGAFRDPSNAGRLTNSLEAQDLNAYYFLHESGLLKVRIGDFSSRNRAKQRAERLQAAGIIAEYFIVSPESHAVERQKFYGTDYLRNEIVRRARSFIGLPYQWGGSSPEVGFDCSGLTQTIYHLVGLNLPRTSNGQYRAGSSVNPDQIRKGDLIFFRTSNSGRVSHVGIYTGGNMFIHAPGKDKTIRAESLSTPFFQNRYAGARTYLRSRS
jgi:hypothetical protein